MKKLYSARGTATPGLRPGSTVREADIMRRRDFVVGAAGAGTALSLFPAGLQGLEREKGPGGLERRALGKTGEKLSVIGFGGIVVMNATTEQAAERVRAAVARVARGARARG